MNLNARREVAGDWYLQDGDIIDVEHSPEGEEEDEEDEGEQ